MFVLYDDKVAATIFVISGVITAPFTASFLDIWTYSQNAIEFSFILA
jgi:hypothetical protein